MLKIETIDSFDKFCQLEPLWNDLLSQSDSDFPFLTHEWLTCWWKAYGSNSKLLILLAKDGDEIAGIAPLMITKTKLRIIPVRAITFAANYDSHRTGIILIKQKKEVVSLILDHLVNYHNYDIIWLDFIVKDSDTDRLVREVLEEDEIKYVQQKSTISPYIPIENTWEIYDKSRSRNVRRSLRKNHNKLKRYGSYKVGKYTTREIDKAIDEVLNITRNSWKHKNGTAIASTSQSIDFYTSIAKIASTKNWLDITMLYLNGEAIAFNFMLLYKEKVYSLKMGYDERYHSLSPGSFIMSQILKDSFEKKYMELDLLGDFEPHKRRWTSTCREHYKYWIFGRGAYGRTLNFLESNIVPPLKKAIGH